MVKQMRKRSRRASERGTTLFVVVLAITMLTGIGLYTVQSSALLARAAGNERQAMQTTYLAQLGTLVTLSQLATNAGKYVKDAKEAKDDCANAQGIDLATFAAPSCYEMTPADLSLVSTSTTLFASDTFGTALDPTTNASPVGGKFLTEITDVSQGPLVPGFAQDPRAPTLYYAKLTTTSELHPASVTAANACVNNVMQVAGQHVTRAHVVIGPVSN
jgi:hypothetical protein